MPDALTKPRKAKPAREKMIFVSDISHWFLKNLHLTGPFTASLCFKDGFIAEIDFEKWMKKPAAGPLRKPLRDAEYFSRVYLDHGALTWPNGFDIDPCAVRQWAEQGFCD